MRDLEYFLHIAQKMKFSITDFFSKCDQIRNGKHFLCGDSKKY